MKVLKVYQGNEEELVNYLMSKFKLIYPSKSLTLHEQLERQTSDTIKNIKIKGGVGEVFWTNSLSAKDIKFCKAYVNVLENEKLNENLLESLS